MSDADAGEIARWLRATTNETMTADRLDRMVDAGQGLLGVDRGQARDVLTSIAALSAENPECGERLAEVVTELERYLREPPIEDLLRPAS